MLVLEQPGLLPAVFDGHIALYHQAGFRCACMQPDSGDLMPPRRTEKWWVNRGLAHPDRRQEKGAANEGPACSEHRARAAPARCRDRRVCPTRLLRGAHGGDRACGWTEQTYTRPLVSVERSPHCSPAPSLLCAGRTGASPMGQLPQPPHGSTSSRGTWWLGCSRNIRPPRRGRGKPCKSFSRTTSESIGPSWCL